MRRILFLSPVGILGGAERALLDALASLRWSAPALDLQVLAFAPGPLEEETLRLGIGFEVLPLPEELHVLGDSGLLRERGWRSALRLLSSLAKSHQAVRSYIKQLGARIEEIDPDLVHTNGIKAHLLSALAVRKPRLLVWHVHDFLSERPLAKFGARWLSDRVDAAVVVSEAVAADVRQCAPRLAVSTLPNAINIDEFSPGLGNADALDALSGLASAPAGTLRVGLVSTYARWKGQEVFLRAAARVQLAVTARRVRFYLVGGPLYATGSSQFSSEELRGRIQALGLSSTVGLVPFQRSLPWVYRSLDVVVHASTRREPFGRSIVEAMACSRAVIVSASGGAQELVDRDVTGLTHQPGDVEQLAECIQRLLESSELRRQLGSNARLATERGFSRDRLGPALLAIYQSLAFNA